MYSFEWQSRGSPHVHCLLWLEDAPLLGLDSEEDFVKLADQLVQTEVQTGPLTVGDL